MFFKKGTDRDVLITALAKPEALKSFEHFKSSRNP